MEYKIKAVETRYGGVLFRSRLEARWAAMFDLLRWRWHYEPIDFDGWFPDFLLVGHGCDVFVEVKPVTTFPHAVAEKIEHSGCETEVLIVGASWFRYGWGAPIIGWLAERESGFWWAEAALGRWSKSDRIGFCHTEGIFSDRISGCYDGGHFGDGEVYESEIEMMWREAGNRTRWNPRGRLQ